jgi:arylsulfatase
LEEDIKRYEQTYAAGWDAVREARHRRLIEEGLLTRDNGALPPRREQSVRWEDNPTKQWDARAMATHAAMVDRMDQGVGRIVSALGETDELENTLILFLSDNGASPEVYRNPGFDRPSQTRDGRRITYPPDKSVMPGSRETFFYIGPAWAEVANTPLRLWKSEMHEGGICTPLIAHWPAGMKAPPGSVTHQPGHVIDVMATCAEVAGTEYPSEFNRRKVTPLEGKSLTPTFTGGPRDGHPFLAWEHYGARAIRRGDWKLVARKDRPWELYDLSKDRTELHDLAAAEPQRVRDMFKLWEQWAKESKVYPAPRN